MAKLFISPAAGKYLKKIKDKNLSILLDYRYFIVICYKSFYNFTMKK